MYSPITDSSCASATSRNCPHLSEIQPEHIRRATNTTQWKSNDRRERYLNRGGFHDTLMKPNNNQTVYLIRQRRIGLLPPKPPTYYITAKKFDGSLSLLVLC
jgi:hypothetical protein